MASFKRAVQWQQICLDETQKGAAGTDRRDVGVRVSIRGEADFQQNP